MEYRCPNTVLLKLVGHNHSVCVEGQGKKKSSCAIVPLQGKGELILNLSEGCQGLGDVGSTGKADADSPSD